MDADVQNQYFKLLTSSAGSRQICHADMLVEDIALSTELGIHGEGGHLLLDIKKPKQSQWSIAWSDLMMTMFIFFVILYIYQAANREFAIGAPDTTFQPGSAEQQASFSRDPSADDSMQNSRSPEAGMQSESIASQVLPILKEEQAVRLILPGDLLFDPGQASLKHRAIQTLKDIAAILQQSPYMVNVVGHTDNLPIHSDQYPTNWELSTLRACQVARFLIEEMHLPSHRFFVTGHAYHQPIKSNVSAAGRSANRRVEIIITRARPTGVASASMQAIELGAQMLNESK
jgi:chemotaxis protein MotB